MLSPVQESLKGYPGIDDSPDLFQDPGGVRVLVRWCIGHPLPEGGKEKILMGRQLGGIEWESCAQCGSLR